MHQSIVNAVTAVLTAVALGATSCPAGAVIRAYVANTGDDTVSVIDTATDDVVATVPVATHGAAIAVHPDGSRVYVGGSQLSVIDTATNSVIATIPVYPNSLAIHPDGRRLYVGEGNALTVVDTRTNTVAHRVPVRAVQVAVNPNGNYVYATSADFFSNDADHVVDTVTYATTTSWCRATVAMSVAPDGSRLYCTNTVNGVFAVDATAQTLIETRRPGGYPYATAVHPDGSRLYETAVSIYGFPDYVFTLDLHDPSDYGGTLISQADGLNGIGVHPDGTRLYVVGRSGGSPCSTPPPAPR